MAKLQTGHESMSQYNAAEATPWPGQARARHSECSRGTPFMTPLQQSPLVFKVAMLEDERAQ